MAVPSNKIFPRRNLAISQINNLVAYQPVFGYIVFFLPVYSLVHHKLFVCGMRNMKSILQSPTCSEKDVCKGRGEYVKGCSKYYIYIYIDTAMYDREIGGAII